MKSASDLELELDDLVHQHYYSEEFELQAAVTAWRNESALPEQHEIDRMFQHRLVRDPSFPNISISRCFPGAKIEAALIERLNQLGEANQLARNLLAALRGFSSVEAAQSVERFLDSSLEMEALHALAEISFERAMQHLPRAIRKDTMAETCLHVFHEHRKRVGWKMFLNDIHPLAQPDSEWMARRLSAVFMIKAENKTPFSPDEQRQIINHIHPSAC